MMPAPEIETRPWAEQLAVDDAAYRDPARLPARPLALLPRQAGAADVGSAGGAGGLADIARAAAHRQERAQGDVHGRQPDRRPPLRRAVARSSASTRRAAPPARPSYIPLTAADLDNWVTGSARSYAASGIAAGQRIVTTYNAGPFVAGAALAAFERIGLGHVPVGTGNTERLMRAVELLRPDAVVLTPSYAAHLVEWAAERDFDLAGSSVERVLVAGEPGGGEPAFRAELEEGWGARVTEAMGIGDIGVVAVGRVRASGRDAPRRARVRPRRADRPGDAAPRSRSTTAPPASSC